MPNTLTLLRYGSYATGAGPGSSTVAAGHSFATAFTAGAPATMWVTLAGAWVGKGGASNCSFVASVYDEDSSGVPRTRLGYFATATASAAAPSSGSGGASVTAAVSVSDTGPTSAGILLINGRKYAIDLLAVTNSLGISLTGVGASSANALYTRTAPGNPPPAAYGANSPAGALDFVLSWLEGWQNVAPVTPATGLAPSGSVTSTTPTFTADFRDLNGAWGASSGSGINTGDQLNQYHVQVRAVGTTTPLLWDTIYSASSTEKAANAVSKTYAGSTLTRGTAYEWRIQQSDAGSAWSGWSAWTSFTPVSLGFVTLDNTPTGKVLAISGSTALDFHGKWNHQTAATMTLAQVRLLDQNGVVQQTGAQAAPTGAPIASSALPGTLFTATWAQTTFTALGWGRSWQYQIRGYDGANWSDWSAARAFTTDAAPTVPSGLTPSGGSVKTQPPLLAASFSDADDTSAGTLTGVFRITRPDTSTVDVTPTYNATSGKWEFQTTVTQLSAFGVYSWKATGFDGTLYSGEATLLTNATFSSSATFDYESGPVVAVSAPANNSTVTTAAVPVSWSVSSGGPQTKYQILVYADGTNTVLYDSGMITSTATSATIPSGFVHGVTPTNYDLVVAVTGAAALVGSSNIVNITVSFTAPSAPTNPQAAAIQIGNDPNPTALQFTWDMTPYSTSDAVNGFLNYNIYVSADSGPDMAEVLYAQPASPTEVSIIYPSPASGATYTFSVTVVTQTGTDQLESARASAQAGVTLQSNVFALVGNGVTYRANLTAVTERFHERQIVEAVYVPLGSSDGSPIKPTTVRSKARYWTSDYRGVVVTDAYSTARQKYDEFEALDAKNGTCCWTDGRGKKRFLKIVNLKITDELPDFYSFIFTTREEHGA